MNNFTIFYVNIVCNIIRKCNRTAVDSLHFSTCSTYPISSTRSQRTLGVGTNGEPSYNTTELPAAKADTNQFHIIQPVWKQPTVINKKLFPRKVPKTMFRQANSVYPPYKPRQANLNVYTLHTNLGKNVRCRFAKTSENWRSLSRAKNYKEDYTPVR